MNFGDSSIDDKDTNIAKRRKTMKNSGTKGPEEMLNDLIDDVNGD